MPLYVYKHKSVLDRSKQNNKNGNYLLLALLYNLRLSLHCVHLCVCRLPQIVGLAWVSY